MDSEITALLSRGDLAPPEALNLLFDRLYDELRAIAARRLEAERSDHTLSTTALVNEAYLKLADLPELEWKNRSQFFAIAARAMRRILVNHARDRKAGKRGGGAPHVTLTAGMTHEPAGRGLSWDEVIVVETAMEGLYRRNERQARIAELRLFGGLTHKETAEVLGISEPTVQRDWRVVRAFLGSALGEDPTHGGHP